MAEAETHNNGVSTKGIVSHGKQKRNKFAIFAAILGSMISVLLGYDNGVMSGATLFIKEDLKISDTQIEITVGIINICSLLGSAVAGRISDRIGRRYTIVLASAIFFLGAILMGLAASFAWLLLGRIVAGIGVGFALLIAPVYTAEISPATSRGMLTSFPEVFINCGVLIGYISNIAFSKLPVNINWRIMLGIGGIPSLLLAFGIIIMPESPRWLVIQGRLGDAKKVLRKICDSEEEAELRLAEIKSAVGISEASVDEVVPAARNNHGEGVWKDLLLHPTPSVRRILIAAVGINFFQQASGIDSVVYYSPRIFEKAGIKTKSTLLLVTVCVGTCKTLCILIATFLLDKYGRRKLLLSSAGGMFLSLVGLASGLTVVDLVHKDVTWAIVLCVITTLTFVGWFSIGLGPIPWVYSSEIFPIRLRAQGVGICVAVNRVMSGIIGMTFLSLYKAITIKGSFFLFAGITGIAFLFFYTFLPETRGRTLEEMEILFSTSDWRSVEKKSNGKDVEENQNVG